MHVYFSVSDPLSGVPLVLDLIRRMSIPIEDFTLSRESDELFEAELVIAVIPDGKFRNLLDKISQLPAVVVRKTSYEKNFTAVRARSVESA